MKIQDKRTTDTKNMIARTCMELLEKKSIDKITVKDITTECQISRQTFYYHYQDVISVFEYNLEMIFKALEKQSVRLNSPKDAIRLMLQAGLDNQKLITKIQSMKTSQNMNQYAIQIIAKTMYHILENRQPDNLDLKRSDMEVMLEFYSYGLASYLATKLMHGKYDVDKLTEQLYQIMKGELSPLKE